MMSLIFKDSLAEDPTVNASLLNGLITALTGINLALYSVNKSKSVTELTPAEKLAQIRSTNMVSNLTLTSYMLTKYYLTNEKKIKPAAVLAGVPLGTVQELSMALSDRIVKYRATGGIFLAHQDGGNESLRIICKAWGKSRNVFLILLDWLFAYGSSKALDMFEGLKQNPFKRMISGETPFGLLSSTTQVGNPWRLFEETAVDEGREEYHMTFPIVTKNRVYSNMYIETYDIVESVNNGMNMMTISLFLRKYRPPYPLELLQYTHITMKGKKVDTTYWYRSQKAEGQAISTSLRSLRWLDSIMDFGLSLIIAAEKYYREQEYTIYTPEQMWMLTFATGLDKSSGLNKTTHIGITTEEGTITNLSEEFEQSMGVTI